MYSLWDRAPVVRMALEALLYNITVIILSAVARITKNNLVYTVVKGLTWLILPRRWHRCFFTVLECQYITQDFLSVIKDKRSYANKSRGMLKKYFKEKGRTLNVGLFKIHIILSSPLCNLNIYMDCPELRFFSVILHGNMQQALWSTERYYSIIFSQMWGAARYRGGKMSSSISLQLSLLSLCVTGRRHWNAIRCKDGHIM